MEVKIVTEGHTGVVVRVRGSLNEKAPLKVYNLIDFNKLNPVPKALKLDSVVFAIQEKMGVILWWRKERGSELMLPLESRGRLDWEAVQSLQSGPDVTGVDMTVFGVNEVKQFVFVMDFTKLDHA